MTTTPKLPTQGLSELEAYYKSLPKERVEEEMTAIKEEVARIRAERTTITQALNANKLVRCWSRGPGEFVHPETGVIDKSRNFFGTVRNWYGGLVEIILNSAHLLNNVHDTDPEKMFILTSPEGAIILENTLFFYKLVDSGSPEVSVTPIGELFQIPIFRDPYFPVNKIMVGEGDLTKPGNLLIRNTVVIEIQRMSQI